MRWIMLGLLVLGLGGCSLTRDVPPKTHYMLVPEITLPEGSRNACADQSLRVAVMNSAKPYQSAQIQYFDESGRIYVYNNARWDLNPTEQLQQIIESSLIRTGMFEGVSPYRSLVKNKLLLEPRITKMTQTVYADGTSETTLEMYFIFLDQYRGAIIDERRFVHTVKSDGVGAAAAVDGWNRSAGIIVTEMLAWLKGICDAYGR